MHINLGRWTEEELDRTIRAATKIADPGQRIGYLSEHFLGSPYQESTLIGSERIEEELVLNLGGLDCFTFIDYVEAMRLSIFFSEIKHNLAQVRYKNGLVSYRTRNHFFTDWAAHRSAFVRDITEEIGVSRAKNMQKTLNLRNDGTYFLDGVAPVGRTITYIPTDEIDTSILEKLRTGDYAGIYSGLPGLDVSHVGIIIRSGASLFLRHASSSSGLGKVADQDLMKYIKNKSGLIILRPI